MPTYRVTFTLSFKVEAADPDHARENAWEDVNTAEDGEIREGLILATVEEDKG